MDEKKIDLKLSFDAKNDVLYCSFGEPREAYSLELEDGVFARLDPETGHAVGVTVVDFCKKFVEHPDKMLSFSMTTEIGLRFAHT